MAGAVSFAVSGKPFAKKRARGFYNKRMGRAVTVNDPANRSFEDTVRAIAAPLFSEPLTGAVKLTVVAVFEPAASWSKKRRDDALGTPHTQKPDGDNIIKAIKDGLNRIAWADDCQVSDAAIRKEWGNAAETIVIVEPAAFGTWRPNDYRDLRNRIVGKGAL